MKAPLLRIDGGEICARALELAGVRHAFVLHGGHLDPILQACLDHGIRLIDTRHEPAAGLGCHGEHVERAEDIAPAVARALASNRPACIDIAVDLDAVPSLDAAAPTGRRRQREVVLPYYDA